MTKALFLMWLSDVAGHIELIGVVCLSGLVVIGCIVIVSQSIEYEDGRIKETWRYARWLCIPVAIAMISPNQSTIRLSAAVSASEALASSQFGQKSMQAIDALLDRILSEAKVK